jgi:Gluconate 2-dehydrogenase subunit 3
MQRRDLLKSFGAATALALLPHEAVAAWARVASGLKPANGLTTSHLVLVGAIADTILPRTDSPSASDVGVPAFVDVIVSENYTDANRITFVAGLDALEAQFQGGTGVALQSPSRIAFADLSPENRGLAIEAIEKIADRRTGLARTHWQLKGLIIHGYFTSERVQKDLLKFEMMPGRFDGAAPMRAS